MSRAPGHDLIERRLPVRRPSFYVAGTNARDYIAWPNMKVLSALSDAELIDTMHKTFEAASSPRIKLRGKRRPK